MPPFEMSEDGGFFTVHKVPIFEVHSNRGFPCDEGWMKSAIANHAQYKKNGYLPTIVVGHNKQGGQEKEAIGFFDKLVFEGKRLYADLVRIPKRYKEKVLQNAYPNRSVEVLPKAQRILTLALLGGTTPHFPLPQMVYEENQEKSEWFRSPKMLNDKLTEDERAELYETVGQAVAEHVPEAIANAFQGDDGDGETAVFFDEVTGEEYAVPASLLPLLKKAGGAVAKGAGRIAGGAAAIKAAPAVGRGAAAAGRGVQRAAGAVGRGASKVAGAARRHPGPTGAIAAAGGVGAAALAARRKKKQGYAIDEDSGEVFYDGEPLGMVFTYEELREVGMKVPTATKRPDNLPNLPSGTPDMEPEEGSVGTGSLEATGLEEDPGQIAGDIVQPLDRVDSDQFALENTEGIDPEEFYALEREVTTIKNANALLQTGRRAEAYKKWLQEQQTAGAPVGDIEQTITFMMSQTPEQVEEFKSLLLKLPKVALGRMTESVVRFDDSALNEVKQDYEANKETYKALGVKDQDLQWARFVRTNAGTPIVQ